MPSKVLKKDNRQVPEVPAPELRIRSDEARPAVQVPKIIIRKESILDSLKGVVKADSEGDKVAVDRVVAEKPQPDEPDNDDESDEQL